VLQIHLIALDDILWVLGSPPCHHPAEMADITGYISPWEKQLQVKIFTQHCPHVLLISPFIRFVML
jgi:hypothetical protein